ncbi:helix-turn-helix transcriptional regulator [Maridesulfovibrio zosterae]|uniref:helix-turn-helix transcriptional regulator n=1 Tax=Maridesulfovibrio zosterae TaxID=82171 RepID=UPI00040ECF6A|nr:AraC family transcriptional regulator [Maridesulfovibrio zosterae]
MNGSLFTPQNNKVWSMGEVAANSAVRVFDHIANLDSSVDSEPVWREMKLRPGLRVSAFEGTLSSDFSFSYQKKNTFLDFGFFLEGAIVNNLCETSIGPFRIENFAGYGGLGFFQEMAGSAEPAAQGKVRSIHLHIIPELLHELLAEDIHAVHDDLKNLLENQGEHDFFLQHSMDPVVQIAANELFYGLSGGHCTRMYLEGKALELIGFQVMKLESKSGVHNTVLTPKEVEQLKDVQAHLKEKFDAPPSMAELSKTHMMSISKIQSGFQELFGMSVFGFLKEYRLRKARMFFENGDMNVSEVGWALGYTNLSHFSTAYKKRYGILPKQFLNSVRERKVICSNCEDFKI